MGDPKFPRRKYETPSHPWQATRIKEEKELQRKYGLKNKTEVWKARSLLRSIRGQARDLQGKQRLETPQVRRETKGLLNRLNRLGMLDDTASLDDVLRLNVEAVLMRRLQTQAYLKGLASTPTQARQLIVHGHVSVDGRRVTVPGYLVTRAEEGSITYAPGSPLENENHPVRPKVLEVEHEGGAPSERTETTRQVETPAAEAPSAAAAGGEDADRQSRSSTPEPEAASEPAEESSEESSEAETPPEAES